MGGGTSQGAGGGFGGSFGGNSGGSFGGPMPQASGKLSQSGAPLSQPDMTMPTGGQQASNAYSYTAPQNLTGGQQPFSSQPNNPMQSQSAMQQAYTGYPQTPSGNNPAESMTNPSPMPQTSGKLTQAANNPQIQAAANQAMQNFQMSPQFKRGGRVAQRKLTTKEMQTLTQALAIAKHIMGSKG